MKYLKKTLREKVSIKKLLPLFLLVFFVQFSCQKEELIPLTSLDEKGFGEEISIRTLYADDLENIPLLQKEWMKMDFSEKNLHTIHNRIPEQRTLSVTESNISQFEIDYSLAKEISYHSIITYTFQLKDVNNIVSNKLINLLYIKYPEEERMRRIVVVYHKDGNGRDTGNDLEFIISTHSISENGNIYPPIDSEDYPKTTYGGILLDEVIIIGPPRVDDIDFPWDGHEHEQIFPGNPGGGGSGGGGGNGNNIPTIPVENTKTPCESINELYSTPYLTNELKDLYEKRKDSIEHGFTYDKNKKVHQGTNGTPTSLNIKTSNKTVGVYHTHPSGSIFSIADFFNFTDVLLKTDTSLNNVTSTVLTNSTYNYMLTFEGDEQLFKSLFSNGNSPFNDRNEFNRDSIKDLYDEYIDLGHNIDTSFLYIIENHLLKLNNFTLEDLGIKIVRFKLSEDGNTITYSEEISLSPFGKLDRRKC